MYLMWGMLRPQISRRQVGARQADMDVWVVLALTLLAQLNPLIAPRRADLRPEHVEKMALF